MNNYLQERSKIDFLKIENKQLAGFWRRLTAYFIDSIISLIIISILAGLSATGFYFSSGSFNHKGFEILYAISVLLGLIFHFWNRIYLQSKTGQSLGKKFLGLYILQDDGNFMSTKTSWKKELSYLIEFTIGSLLPIFRKDKKRLADIIAKTSVYYLDDKKYKFRFYASLVHLLLSLITPSVLIFSLFYYLEFTSPEKERKERVQKYEEQKRVEQKEIERKDAIVSDYVEKINSRTKYPIDMGDGILWINTKKTETRYPREDKFIHFEYQITDTTKTDQELIYRWKNTSFYPIRDLFLEKGVCSSEEGQLTLSGIILKYEFFVGEKSVGDFIIVEQDCIKK